MSYSFSHHTLSSHIINVYCTSVYHIMDFYTMLKYLTMDAAIIIVNVPVSNHPYHYRITFCGISAPNKAELYNIQNTVPLFNCLPDKIANSHYSFSCTVFEY